MSSAAAAAAMFGHETSQRGHSSLPSQEVGHNPPQPSAAGGRATQHSMAAVQDAIAATAALVDRLQSRLAPRLRRPRPSHFWHELQHFYRSQLTVQPCPHNAWPWTAACALPSHSRR
ncbi:hypothetical protein HaLaN_04051 [Haematococcus lacustris]|uniref:Uncharacterized protein n=1 Tax=Haematococcus lacustris TaxID=44745 RepID=A0A699YIE4_HAELA|nr:hypothetical protein HaLaN_04051 [Haematococcus lacustris]